MFIFCPSVEGDKASVGRDASFCFEKYAPGGIPVFLVVSAGGEAVSLRKMDSEDKGSVFSTKREVGALIGAGSGIWKPGLVGEGEPGWFKLEWP